MEKDAHSVLDRFNRSHCLFQRLYSPSRHPRTRINPQNHASYLISRRHERERFIANRINTDNIHTTHDELDSLGEMYAGAGWKHDKGYQIQVIFHGYSFQHAYTACMHLSSAKVGHTIQHSLERNYESLLMQIRGEGDIPLLPSAN